MQYGYQFIIQRVFYTNIERENYIILFNLKFDL